MAVFEYCAAVTCDGKVFRISDWYLASWAARAEIEQMRRGMNMIALTRRVFILRRLVNR